MIKVRNIFKNGGVKLREELVEKLVSAGEIVRLEKIVSPKTDVPSRVYDRDEDEFVMLARGYAELEFGDEGKMRESIHMTNGDYIHIPAHLKHRVVRTDEGTTWLALFYKR